MVSVIIPNFNHAQYLKLRLDSVLNQTYSHFEVIVLDDCSTDNSREIIEQYRGNTKISNIIYNETNTGNTFKQWQKGIEHAKGKYVWIAESDDWCEPAFLTVLVDALEQNGRGVLAYVQSCIINSNNDILKISEGKQLGEYVTGPEYISDHLVQHNAIFNASMVLFKKDCYFNVPSKFASFKFCGDWLFWIEIVKQGDVFISGKVLNYFRKHLGDVTGKVHLSGYNFIEELEILKILKREQFINEEQFKKQLLDWYTGYLLNRNRFVKEMKLRIENSFFIADGVSYKDYLTHKSNQLTLIKLKARRRLKRVIDSL